MFKKYIFIFASLAFMTCLTFLGCITSVEKTVLTEKILVIENNVKNIENSVNTTNDKVEKNQESISQVKSDVERLMNNAPYITVAGKRYLPSEAPKIIIGSSQGKFISPVVTTGKMKGILTK